MEAGRNFDKPAPPAPLFYSLSLHDALPISPAGPMRAGEAYLLYQDAQYLLVRSELLRHTNDVEPARSEEHTSELRSRRDLVCRLLLEKKKVSRRRVLESDMEAGRNFEKPSR